MTPPASHTRGGYDLGILSQLPVRFFAAQPRGGLSSR
jgi:hypothetical protein